MLLSWGTVMGSKDGRTKDWSFPQGRSSRPKKASPGYAEWKQREVGPQGSGWEGRVSDSTKQQKPVRRKGVSQ